MPEQGKKAPARAAVQGQTFDAVVVGAGFSGLYMVHKLREAGLTVQGFEAGGGVGGTWYWNRYPGARCDVPSIYYSNTWSDELQDEWRWSEKYSPQPEILGYANHVADRYDLRRSFLFDTRVTKATFDETSGLWTIETEKGDRVQAQFCIMGTGTLSIPREPDYKGVSTFKGEIHVTGRWPHEPVDFAGKRVAVIGTGSSAIQVTPMIAEQAKSLHVFQRTAAYTLPARNVPLSDEDIAAFRADFANYRQTARKTDTGLGEETPMPDGGPSDEQWQKLMKKLWNGGGLLSLYNFPNVFRDIEVNTTVADFVREKIGEIVKDPETAEKLMPRSYPIGTKRACLDTNYYATFNRDNVSLVDLRQTPIEEITPDGIRTSREFYPLDIIVFATGFDAMTGALLRIDIRGSKGVSLRDEWAQGPKNYIGLGIAGFPNLFMVTGPGSPSVLGNYIVGIEQHVEWITDCINYMRKHKLTRIEATSDAQDAWMRHVADIAAQTLFPRANSWYMGANVPGKPRIFMAYVGGGYRQKCDEVAAKNYEGFDLAG